MRLKEARILVEYDNEVVEYSTSLLVKGKDVNYFTEKGIKVLPINSLRITIEGKEGGTGIGINSGYLIPVDYSDEFKKYLQSLKK